MNNFKLQFPLIVAGILAFTSCKKQEQERLQSKATQETSVAPSLLLTYTMSNWMGSLPDATNVAQLSIPGTHDSGARTEPVGGTAKCQNLSIADQLTAGVRYLDIRCRH